MALSPRQIVGVLLRQGSTILCGRCREPITHQDDMEREHVHERALGGSEGPENCMLSHTGCHAQITNGAPATTAGGSKHKIAHTRRLAKEAAIHAAVMAGDTEREPSRLQGRGFSRVHQPMRRDWRPNVKQLHPIPTTRGGEG